MKKELMEFLELQKKIKEIAFSKNNKPFPLAGKDRGKDRSGATPSINLFNFLSR